MCQAHLRKLKEKLARTSLKKVLVLGDSLQQLETLYDEKMKLTKVSAYSYLMKDPQMVDSDFYSKTIWQNCYISFIKPVSGQSMWVKTGLPPPMPPKKRVMPGRPKGKRQKHPSEVNNLSLKGKAPKEDENGRNSQCSGLHEDADLANADHPPKCRSCKCISANWFKTEKTITEDHFEQMEKPFQFDEHGTGSTTENAFDISNE
ncbi:hypothetical protein Tco_0128223 [Tanacetum coccineum]